MNLTFSKEIRLGEIIAAGMLLLSVMGWGNRLDVRIQAIEVAQTTQSEGAKQMRDEFRTVTQSISADVKEQGVAIRRVEDKINRARL